MNSFAATLLSNSEDITLGRVLGSVGVERLVDLVIATASLGVVSLLVELPRRFNRLADILGVVTLVVISIVVALILYLEAKLGDNPPEAAGRRIPGERWRRLPLFTPWAPLQAFIRRCSRHYSCRSARLAPSGR